jgi:hypothetical protein
LKFGIFFYKKKLISDFRKEGKKYENREQAFTDEMFVAKGLFFQIFSASLRRRRSPSSGHPKVQDRSQKIPPFILS